MEVVTDVSVYFPVMEAKQLRLKLDKATAVIIPHSLLPVLDGDIVIISQAKPQTDPGNKLIMKLPVSMGTLATLPFRSEIKRESFNSPGIFFYLYNAPRQKIRLKEGFNFFKVCGFLIPESEITPAN